nr:hypothetical protein [Tanacetum cinerariifolium]
MGNASNNASFAYKPKTPPPPKKDNPTKDAICHQCGEVGHWRRNCPMYLAKLMKKKKLSQGASTSSIFTIELYSFLSKSWIYNTGCGTYICITTQGLRGSKKLKPGALSLYVGDGHRTAVEVIGTYHLELPSGLVIVLNNCHYAPFITRGVILVSRLFDDGFVNRFDDNNVISISKNKLVYFKAIPRDGIYEIDMSSSNTNDSSIKMAIKPYSHQVERAKDLLGLIHTDVCSLFKIVSRQGASYFVTFTDDFSRYGYVYLLKHKHEVFETFKVFQKEVENQLGKTIKSLRSDCGERRNRTLLDMVRSMMSQTTLPKSFWDYALETAARILNMVPTKKVDKTPYEIWNGQAPKLSYLKETIGYSFYSPSENKVFIARNAEFFESKLLDLKASGSVEDLELIQEEDTNPSVDTSLDHEEDDQEINEPQSDINPIRKSSRTRLASDRMCLYIDAEEHELGDLGEPAKYKVALLDPESKKWLDAMNVEMQSMKDNDEHELGDLGEPANYKAALLDPGSKQWLDAINVEMQSMKDNDVWVLVELPPNARTVGSKWLFKKKTDMDGAVYIFKARLVAKGFTQTYGVDYEETFSPVADIRAIRILIAIAAYYDYEIWQMDVKTTFLNGHLSKEFYMEKPEGFVNPKYPNHVCKLKRSIYGLKQASRQWNKRFDDEIKKFGFTQNPDEPCVYLKAREAAYILGIKIYRDRSKRLIGLCQKAYIEKILKRFYMENSKRGTIPMQEKLKLSNSQGASTPAEKQRVQNIPYASANPGEEHWTAVKNILKYLRNTKDMFLVYGGNMERELKVSCYTDAGYLTDADNLKS